MEYTESQMSWMIRKGYAWAEMPISEWDWKQPLYTRKGMFLWEPPHIGKDGKVVEGRYIQCK